MMDQTIRHSARRQEAYVVDRSGQEKELLMLFGSIRCLHIDADEDHVAAQFYEKKGDLEHDRSGRKINTLMRKLVCVYEDIKEESGEKAKNKRYRLTGKYYFCRLYPGKENERPLEEVRDYIYVSYDANYLERVYIAGDGALWLKVGCEVLEKAHYVLDRFHMEKCIHQSVVHLFDSAQEVKDEIYRAIYGKNRSELKEIYGRLLGVTNTEGKIKGTVRTYYSCDFLLHDGAGTGHGIRRKRMEAASGCSDKTLSVCNG